MHRLDRPTHARRLLPVRAAYNTPNGHACIVLRAADIH
jgi:hypothetical protein